MTQRELIDAITKEGQSGLDLWRKKNPNSILNFDGVDFTKDAFRELSLKKMKFEDEVSFKEAVFGNEFSFEEVEFCDNVNFLGATFGNSIIFSKCKFGKFADFRNTKFEDDAIFFGIIVFGKCDFSKSRFGKRLNFRYANLGKEFMFLNVKCGDRVDFSRAIIGDYAKFNNSKFGKFSHFYNIDVGDHVAFHGVEFGTKTIFRGAKFGAGASFSKTVFDGDVSFHEARFDESVSFSEASFAGVLDFEKVLIAGDIDFSTSNVNTKTGPIRFAQSQVRGHTHFLGRKFDERVDFSYARFGQVPDFRNALGCANFDLSQTRFNFGGYITFTILSFNIFRFPVARWTTDVQVLGDLRRLRGIAKDIHAVDMERDLFILERNAELGVMWSAWLEGSWREFLLGWWRPLFPTIVILLYGISSNSGRSFWLPLSWLCLINIVIYYLYLYLYNNLIEGPISSITRKALLDFSLASALPFATAARPTYQSALAILFGSDESGYLDIPWQFQLVSGGQGVLNLVLFFLLVLAIRNYFRFR